MFLISILTYILLGTIKCSLLMIGLHEEAFLDPTADILNAVVNPIHSL
jgi:hypothetical protein